jgi:dienelactone hydrolase
MRFFEIVLLIACSILPFIISLKGIRSKRKLVLIAITSILALHLIIEGYRWQMIPAYVLALIIIWCCYKSYTFFKGKWLGKTITSFGFILIVLLAWALPIILPIFNLPTPTGKFSVGSQYLHLKTDADEIITPETNDTRELMIKVWYPAQLNNEVTEPYLNAGDRIGFATKYGLPKSTFNYLDAIKTHTYESPAVKEGKFPVLIFSHGLYSKASGYYALIEHIVSHGYIVLNINHTYESTGSVFPNGDLKLFHTEYDKIHNNHDMSDMVWDTLKAFKKAKTSEEKLASIEYLVRNYMAAEITKRWSSDISLVIDELGKWNSASFLAQHLDVSKIGVFGHSQGGSAAGQAIIENDKIKAGISIDGVQWGTMIDTVLTKPFAIITSDWDSSHPNFNKHIYRNRSVSNFYNVKLLKSGHPNFMDIPLMINLPLINECGPIDPVKGFEITNKMILQFFDSYLLNKTNDLLNLNTKYEEIKIELLHKNQQNLR